jgi:hypothetical protein
MMTPTMDAERIEGRNTTEATSPTRGNDLDSAQEIIFLRGKLERRSSLLDVIRKAYHRDVLVLKECLIDAQRRDLGLHGNNRDSSLELALKSVPSIDLRETFRLFAPQECELRVRPCWSCGGQLEVIHRESSRIVEFKHSIQMLWEREKDLCEELIGVKVMAQKDRDILEDVMNRNQDERDVLLEQISSLKQQVADRNALDAEVRRLNDDVRNLKATLNNQEPLLLDRERLLVEIESIKSNAEQDQLEMNVQAEQSTQLQIANDLQTRQLLLLGQEHERLRLNFLDACERCKQADDTCFRLRRELSQREVEANDVMECFKTTEATIDELKRKCELDERQMRRSIADLESKCSTLEATVSELDDKLHATAADSEMLRKSIEATLEDAMRRGLITCVPRQSNVALATVGELICETDHLRHKSATLFNLLLSCIRSTYESCLKQERFLRDYGSELHQNDQKLKFSEQGNAKARMVLEHLANADDSNTIEWVSFLADDTDRRHIMGNLQNRLQMGLFSLDKAFQKVCEIRAFEMRTCQIELDREIKHRCELEGLLTDADRVNRKYERRMINMREMNEAIQRTVDSLRLSLHKTRRDYYLHSNEITAMLKDDYKRIRTLADRLVDELKESKMETFAHKGYLAEKEAELSMRDTAIQNMEALLEKITHKYAEKERLRIKVVHANAAVQAAPTIADASVHADFLPSVVRKGNPVVSENKKADDALLPGRIINVPDENWPSRINIGPMQSGLQFRRALDKL